VPRGSPAGRYALWAGLWKGGSTKRRPAKAPAPIQVIEDRADVGSIEVVP
jgi:hypothetical protein